MSCRNQPMQGVGNGGLDVDHWHQGLGYGQVDKMNVGCAMLCLCATMLHAGALVVVNGCGWGGLGVIDLDDGRRDNVGIRVRDDGGVAKGQDVIGHV